MGHTLSQPEEVHHALVEMAVKDMKADEPVATEGKPTRDPQENWRGSYVSPYRAAYMRLKQTLLDS